MAGKAPTEITECLYVAVRPVYVGAPVTEVNVRYDEHTAAVQELRDLSKFPGLEVSHVLEDSLGDDDVECLVTEFDRRFKEVSFY